MHSYYADNKEKLKKGLCRFMQLVKPELEKAGGKPYPALLAVYFWPGLERCFAQVARILKPGGIFMICNESDGADDTGKKYEGIIDGMKCYTAEQLETALKTTGFSGVSIDHHPSKPWITVIARK